MLLTHMVFLFNRRSSGEARSSWATSGAWRSSRTEEESSPARTNTPSRYPDVKPTSLWRTSLVSKLSLSPLSDCPGGVWYQHSVRLRSEPRQQECLGPEHEGGSVSHRFFVTLRAACTDLLLFLKEMNLKYCTSSAAESWAYSLLSLQSCFHTLNHKSGFFTCWKFPCSPHCFHSPLWHLVSESSSVRRWRRRCD